MQRIKFAVAVALCISVGGALTLADYPHAADGDATATAKAAPALLFPPIKLRAAEDSTEHRAIGARPVIGAGASGIGAAPNESAPTQGSASAQIAKPPGLTPSGAADGVDFAGKVPAASGGDDEDDEDGPEGEADNPPDWIGAAPAQPAPLRPLIAPENRSVERAVQYFLHRKRPILEQGYRRSGRYLPMMQAIFAEEGVPVELAYLAAVESNYNPTAHSRSRAAGLWQFMRGTAGKFGLRVHLPWYDERLDPLYSTRAAARLLATLHDTYHSWELALAAYNAGEGRVNRAIRRARQPEGAQDFWKLRRLPKETKGYVPAFFALARIYNQPELYGLADLEQESPLLIEVVRLEVPAALPDLARRLELSVAELQRLNPAWKRGVIPPFGFEPVLLHVPLGKGQQLLASVRAEPLPAVQWRQHIVRKGDTLSGIAQMYRLKVSELIALNPGRRRILSVGQPVILPLPGDAAVSVAAAPGAVPPATRPQITLLEPVPAVLAPAPRPRPAAMPAPILAAAAALATPASTPRSSREEARPFPAASPPAVPVATAPQAPAAAAPAAPAQPQLQPQAAPVGPAAPAAAPIVPTVAVTPVALVPVPGTTAGLPGAPATSPLTVNSLPSVSQDRFPRALVHRVRQGDTLWSVSRRYGVTISDLKRWNGLRSSRLRPSDDLIVQGKPTRD